MQWASRVARSSNWAKVSRLFPQITATRSGTASTTDSHRSARLKHEAVMGLEVGEVQPEVRRLDPPIDLPHLSCDETSRWRGQIQGGQCDVVGMAQPPEGRIGDHLRPQAV